MVNNRLSIFVVVFLLFLVSFVSANSNESVDSILTLTGNIPTSTIFFAVAGEEDTGSITLEPNQTTLVSCWGKAEDLDGYDDLADLSTVIYAASSDRFASDNESVHYTNNSCDMTNWNVDGTWNCTYNMQYYAEPSEWTCAINITNTEPQYYNDTINTTSIIEELVSIFVPNTTIDFGLRAVGVNYTADTEILMYNLGNVALDLAVDAFNGSSTFEDDSDQAFNCTVGFIPIHYLRFSFESESDYLDAIPMQASGAATLPSLSLAPQRGGSGSFLPTFSSTFWAPAVPMNIAGVCTGRIMYIGQNAD